MALLAVLWAVLAPSLSTLVAVPTGETWIEVCTATGTKRIATDEAPADGNSLHLGEHCPFCPLQQDLPVIAHGPGVRVPGDGSVRGVPPPAALTPPLAVAVWPAHHSRAPPNLS